MQRILLVSIEGKLGGAERSLLVMVKYLQKYFSIGVACPGRSPLSDELVTMAVDIYALPKPPRQPYALPFCLFYWPIACVRLLLIVMKLKPEIMHANNLHSALIAIFVAIVTRAKLVLHVRDLTKLRLFSKCCVPFADSVIAVSSAVKKRLLECGTNPKKIRVVYNAIEKNSEQEHLSSWNLFNSCVSQKSVFVFANVGQFVPWKKHTVFIKAATCVAKELPNAIFAFVGDDLFGRNVNYKAYLHSCVRNSGFAERFFFTGWQGEMNEVWPKIDCLVHTADQEPFGRVVVEAMVNKVPVIAVDAAGPGEIVSNGITGILLKANDVTGLSKAMLEIARKQTLRAELSKRAQKYAIFSFAAEKTMKKILTIYKGILAA